MFANGLICDVQGKQKLGWSLQITSEEEHRGQASLLSPGPSPGTYTLKPLEDTLPFDDPDNVLQRTPTPTSRSEVLAFRPPSLTRSTANDSVSPPLVDSVDGLRRSGRAGRRPDYADDGGYESGSDDEDWAVAEADKVRKEAQRGDSNLMSIQEEDAEYEAEYEAEARQTPEVARKGKDLKRVITKGRQGESDMRADASAGAQQHPHNVNDGSGNPDDDAVNDLDDDGETTSWQISRGPLSKEGEEEVLAMVRSYQKGMTDIARRYHKKLSTVYQVSGELAPGTRSMNPYNAFLARYRVDNPKPQGSEYYSSAPLLWLTGRAVDWNDYKAEMNEAYRALLDTLPEDERHDPEARRALFQPYIDAHLEASIAAYDNRKGGSRYKAVMRKTIQPFINQVSLFFSLCNVQRS